jgi:glycerol-3-phosphate dehydrogenase
MVERVFPKIKVTHEHIVFNFSGVRPLEHSGARTTGQISRDHSIQVISGEWTGLSFPIYSLVGGKWTSFRAFAEQVTDKALAFLGRTRQKSTETLPIGGGRAYPRTEEEVKRRLDSLAAWTGLTAERLGILFQRYGTRLEAMADFTRRVEDAAIRTLPDFTRREIAYVALNEKMIHLDDFLLRRSMLAMLGRLTRDSVEELADAVGEALGWDEAQKQAEAARALSILANQHGVQL